MEKEIWYLPRPATSYRGCYPLHFEKRLKDILETENYVHFFSGSAKTGFRIDIKAETKPDLVHNVEDLTDAIEDNKFEAGFADPPYTPEFAEKLYGTAYPNYNRWIKEMVRIVKRGG